MEDEVIIPDGPSEFKGKPFRCVNQPYSGLLFDAIDTNAWRTIACLGPTQSGKTLSGYIGPLLWEAIEKQRNVALGIPDMDMANDKWKTDILPVFEATRYRDLLPERGGGSRGGRVGRIDLRNGVCLRFMSGGGSDKSRAGFTAGAIAITEVDGMGTRAETSSEANRVDQIIARSLADAEHVNIYLECTVTTPEGLIWQYYTKGSESRIALPCPHCMAWVVPEREHFKGWQDAENIIEARQKGFWHCPACDHLWTPEERRAAVQLGVLVHRGQEIAWDGEGADRKPKVTGNLPPVLTLGFRWSAVHNLFMQEMTLAGEEWTAKTAEDTDNAERRLQQFFHARPYVPTDIEVARLAPRAILQRAGKWLKKQIPDWADFLTVGVDCHDRSHYWVVVAWKRDATCHIVDYGITDTFWQDRGKEPGFFMALRDIGADALQGWQRGGMLLPANAVWIDAGHKPEIVYEFIRKFKNTDAENVFWPTKGFSATKYPNPRKKTNEIRHIGAGYHMVKRRSDRVTLVEINVDAWKDFAFSRLTTNVTDPGAATLFQANQGDHFTFCQHMASERRGQMFVDGRAVDHWTAVKEGKNIHFWDAFVYACAAGHWCGVRVLGKQDDADAILAGPGMVSAGWKSAKKARG